jgi:glycosyltransferase involved in cell wall biosynthesis
MTPRLTVIIPTLGRSTLLKVIKEIQFSDEVVIILLCHGASTFQTLRQLDLKDKIQLVECSEKLSLSDLCNEGLTRVETEFFAFFSDDDAWLPQKYELLIGFLDSNPRIDMVFGSTIEQIKNRKRQRPLELLTNDENVFEYLYSRQTILENKRYLGLQDAIMRAGNYPQFRQSIDVYEDIIWISDAQQMGHKLCALPEVVSIKFPSLKRSSSRQNSISVIAMFEEIRKVNPNVAVNFLKFHAIRASVGSGELLQYIRILRVRILNVGLTWIDFYLIPIQLLEIIYLKLKSY